MKIGWRSALHRNLCCWSLAMSAKSETANPLAHMPNRRAPTPRRHIAEMAFRLFQGCERQRQRVFDSAGFLQQDRHFVGFGPALRLDTLPPASLLKCECERIGVVVVLIIQLPVLK